MSADAKLVLCLAVPVVVALTVALAVCIMLVVLYRRRNAALSGLCRRYRRAAKNTALKLRRVQAAQCLAETQADAAMADKDRELRVNRSLMNQIIKNGGRKEAMA